MPSLEDLPIETLAQIAQLQNTLANNPATRTQYLQLIKKVSPNTVIPEIDAAAPIMAALQEEKGKREALEARLAQEQAERNVLAKRNKTMTEHKLTEEQMVEVEKIMTDNQIPSYDTAAKFYALSQQAAEPTSSNVFAPAEVKLPDETIWQKGIGNPAALNRIAREQAFKSLNEIMGRS